MLIVLRQYDLFFRAEQLENVSPPIDKTRFGLKPRAGLQHDKSIYL